MTLIPESKGVVTVPSSVNQPQVFWGWGFDLVIDGGFALKIRPWWKKNTLLVHMVSVTLVGFPSVLRKQN